MSALDRYPFNSRLLRGALLPIWFAAHAAAGSVVVLLDPARLFFDGRLYLDATRTWLNGGNPWDVQLLGNGFAAPPPSLLPLAPFTALPQGLDVAVLAVLCLAGGIATVRMLGLPWWWLLFPPLVASILAANVQALLIPLVLSRGGAIAVLLKVYAAVPLLLLGRWRALMTAALLLVATAPLLPWGVFVANFGQVASTLQEQTRYALPTPILAALMPLVALSAWVVGARRAAWLVVPAGWPSQQYYYGTFVMPAGSALVAAIVALPVPGAGTLALVLLALVTLRQRREAGNDDSRVTATARPA